MLPGKSKLHLQQPIGDTLTSILTQIIQMIQRIGVFVNASLKPYIQSLTPDQIATINKEYLFLKGIKDEMANPRGEELENVFSALPSIASFSGEMIQVLITEVDKLAFDLLVISKSAGSEYPDVDSAELFQGVQEGAGRSRPRKPRLATNFYGEFLGGIAVPSVWKGKLRNCPTKYLL